MQYKTENTWKESYHDEHIALGRTYVIGTHDEEGTGRNKNAVGATAGVLAWNHTFLDEGEVRGRGKGKLKKDCKKKDA